MPIESVGWKPVQCYGCEGPHYYKDFPYRHNNASPITTIVTANVPLCSGCGIDHLYKDCSMRRAPIDASNPRTTSLNLLGIECRRIAQVSLNAITRMQAKAITRELRKREREGQAGTSQNPKRQNNPTRKQAIKDGKGKDKVIMQSGSDEDTATVATSETTGSLEGKSSQRGNEEEGLREEQITEPRPNTPSGFHEYPNPI